MTFSPPQPAPVLLILSGPSGVGKDAVLERMKERRLPGLKFITTITTRSQRPREIDGKDYHFTNQADFKKLINQNELLEWAEVYGNFYGVPKSSVREALKQGSDVIVKVDVQGAASIKKIAPEAVFVFMLPPSLEELKDRLSRRLTESPETLKRRLETAPEELHQLQGFDYFVVNHDGKIDQAVSEISAILAAEKSKVHPRRVNL
ncbi:guanylate kinase [Dehalogenimonas formicexedens]|uniref:Guanylate kinase n=1 Tax=Dehalogenimonas formicexedens TaxID=1839801 RepID=A0A1P8F4S0_9CHLR|nr:guanylate kinase [Dehalogenimonas formicexedens]APV43445.1 guanylate kinase [Dehalogenimonas formicexedens]